MKAITMRFQCQSSEVETLRELVCSAESSEGRSTVEGLGVLVSLTVILRIRNEMEGGDAIASSDGL